MVQVVLRGARLLATLLVLALVACGCGEAAREPGPAAADPTTSGATAGASPTPTPTSTPTSGSTSGPTTAAPTRPDVLVVETDDMRHDDLRWMPQVRRLVQGQGLTFTSSFAPNPLCCPSRSSLLTGQYSHNTGVFTHEPPYGFASFRDRTTLATALQGGGYRTALVGKYLNGYGYQPLRAHHGRRGPSATYVPPGWTHWAAGIDFRSRELSARLGVDGDTYDYRRLSQNVDGELRTTPGESARVMADQVLGFLGGFARSPDPWFLWWTPIAPHHGGPAEPDDPGPYVDASGELAPLDTPARPDWVKGRFDREISRGAGVRRDGTTEASVADKPGWLRRPELTAGDRAGLLEVARQRAESMYVLDRQVGRVLRELRRTPRGRDTLVVFTSDNGYYQGEHRVMRGKGTLLEPSLRVPLLLAGAGVPRGVRHDPATTIDLAPTIAAYAGVTLPGVDGVDLGPVIRDGDRGWDRPVVAESRMPFALPRSGPDPGLTIRGLRLGGWSVTRYATGAVELYDMRSDPLQLQNLARRPRYADERHRLLGLLERYQDCAGAACAAPLPEDLRLSPAEGAALARAQQQALADYYG